jgi:mannosyltransferase OCH1-like enzyme
MKDIPKICHLYFGGSGPMAQMMVFTILSFHKHNPDWQIIVYKTKQTDKELGANTYVPVYKGKDYFYMIEALPYVQIKVIDITEYGINKDIHSILGSDMFRMNVLYRQGGVYSDFDVIWLKPISDIIDVKCIGNPCHFSTTVC